MTILKIPVVFRTHAPGDSKEIALAYANGQNPARDRVNFFAKLVGVLSLCALAVVLLAGCTGSAINTATLAVNDGRAFLEVSNTSITERCVPLYQAAKTPDDVTAADKVCLPMKKAYLSARVAWMAAVAAVLAVRAGGDPAALPTAWQKMAETAAALAQVIQ